VIALTIALGILAALLQAAVVPAFFLDAWAAPIPACALIAAWAAARRPEETWPIAAAAALVLGVISVERAGWFLLALLPSVGGAILLASVSRENRGLSARLSRGIAAAAIGSLGYAAVLGLGAARDGAVFRESAAVAFAAVGTALLAAIVVTALTPFRRHPVGLFR